MQKKRHGLMDALRKEDRELLLEMILEIGDYNECSSATINRKKDSESNIAYFFFMLLITEQQKLINSMYKNFGIEYAKNKTSLDYAQ